MMRTITITLHSTSGAEYTHDWPATRVVCHDCDGDGVVLHDAIRHHAYSAEEFRESFDDDEAAEYFKGGHGAYGVTCPTCHGARVLDELDEDAVEKMRHGATLLTFYRRQQVEAAQLRAIEAMERRMGA